MGHRVSVVLAIAFLLSPAIVQAAQQDQAKQILSLLPARSGLCVHLGCGREGSPALIAELARSSNFVVHGIALDDASLDRAKKAIAANNVIGRAAAERVPVAPLPYLRDLANLVVIEDLDALARAGLDMGEILRVTAPGGVIAILRDGRWSKTIKPRPDNMDDWTHPHHGADANRVSSDGVIQMPLGLRWQEGIPMNFNLWAACRAWVICNGRLFTLGTTEFENLSPAQFVKHKQDEYLVARDAFNGLPLWKINCETSNNGQALNYRNVAPLVADNDRIYAFKKDALIGVDAASGQIARTYPVRHKTVRLILTDGLLVASGWETVVSKGLWDPWTPKNGNGSVDAFEARTGKGAWALDFPAQGMIAADGLVYILTQDATPATKQEVIAVEAKTGKIRWRIAGGTIASQADLALNVAGQGVVVVAREKDKSIAVLASADGKLLWETKPKGAIYSTLLPGALWVGGTKYEPATGKSIGSLPGIAPGMCTPPAVVGDAKYVTNSRGCSVLDLTSAQPVNSYFGSVRGGCIEGAVPANGLFYAAQNNCRCSPAQVQGFAAFGPCGTVPTKEDFTKPRPIERGPAMNPEPLPGLAGDWPMMFHDPARSSVTSASVPEKLKAMWTSTLWQNPDSSLAATWQSKLTSCLTAPVSSGSFVIAAATDGGQVIAVDAATGKTAWQHLAGSRIDSPPTIHNGLCIFGSHDGWVTALRLADGQLAWRTRLAPVERRMVSFGQVESVWPAIGSVLVHENRLYASAGRSCESDGGLVFACLDPQTGQQTWARQIVAGPKRTNDVLRVQNGKINWYFTDLDPRTGEGEAKPPGKNGSLEGMLDGTWTRIGTRRSGGFALGLIAAEMIASTDETAYAFEIKSRSCFAMKMQIAQTTSRPTKEHYLWRTPLPAGKQAEALAVAKNAMVIAGRTCEGSKVSGFLMLLSIEDGRPIFEAPLAAPPSYQGLAIRPDRIFVTLQDGTLACFGPDAGK